MNISNELLNKYSNLMKICKTQKMTQFVVIFMKIIDSHFTIW